MSPELCGADEEVLPARPIKDFSPLEPKWLLFPDASTTHAHTQISKSRRARSGTGGEARPPAAGVIREPLPELHRTPNSMTFCSSCASSFLNASMYAPPLGFANEADTEKQPFHSGRLIYSALIPQLEPCPKPSQPM